MGEARRHEGTGARRADGAVTPLRPNTRTDERTNGPLSPSDLDYHLPPDRIATRPAEPRDAARMMVCHLERGDVEHRRARDLPEYLGAGDDLLVNVSAVARARLAGRRRDTGGKVEGLYLEEPEPRRWLAMLRSNGRLREGLDIVLHDRDDRPGGYVLRLLERRGTEWLVRLDPGAPAAQVLEAVGRTPLPPYIHGARGRVGAAEDDARDRDWYQTVYADAARPRSVAAPTAGLHFTRALLDRLDAAGVRRLEIALHVGAGTFKPIAAPTLAEHHMHRERFTVPARTLEALHARAGSPGSPGGRLVAVGTTAVRAVESLPEPLPPAGADYHGETDLMIAPPYRFARVDALLTNFHLPRSTLLALVAAMTGLDRLLALYAEAIRRDYRFYSYGDAMLIIR